MSRLIISFSPLTTILSNVINKHHVQGVIYESLRDTSYDTLHSLKTYKFFTFSDFYPADKEFKENKEYYFFISSPDKYLIKTLRDNIPDNVNIGQMEVEIKTRKMVNIKPRKIKFITASPIITIVNNKYLSFYHGTNLALFLQEIKKTSIDKFNSFYNDEFNFDGEIFDRLVFRKSVASKFRIKGREVIYIGSMWRLLERKIIDKDLRKFYQFIFDAGIGEKCSLGFGALNEYFPNRRNK